MKFPASFLGLALLALTGCVSSKYKLAEYERQAAPLNLTVAPDPARSAPAFDALVNTVIVLQGPGSWKRNAYWDEYVVTFTNRGIAPVIVHSATLTDFQGQPTSPGSDPWFLEKQSRDYESRIASTLGDVLKIGGGMVLAGVAGLTTGVSVAWASSAAEAAAASIVVLAIPLYAVGTVYRNVSNKHKIETEFAQRSLPLPLVLVPGKIAQGSLFFRVSPGPQRLTLRCHIGDEPHEVVIALAPLSRLHLKPANPAPTQPPTR